jgi:hypothetical protein
MATRSAAARVVGAVADATGRSDEEVALALTVGAAAAALMSALFAALHLFGYLEELDFDLLGSSKARS